jgi:hypothetical protein
MDDDHANGICMLTDELVNDGNQANFSIDHLWVNTFDDIIGNIQLPVISAIGASSSAASISSLKSPILKNAKHHIAAVIASTGQGRQLRDNADTLSITLNHPFKKMSNGNATLVRGDTKESAFKFSGLNITVVNPDNKRLEKLQKKWDDDLKIAKKKGDDKIIFASVASLDTSPFNLSSIACLVELNGKKILLTGDGRSDDIQKGLAKNKLLDSKGKLHVDILKMPHHGSIRNMEKVFLEKITADHYVISADGRDDNPDKKLLNLLVSTVTKGTVHLTNKTGKLTIKKDVTDFLNKIASTGSQLKVEFPKTGKDSMMIDLLDPVTF